MKKLHRIYYTLTFFLAFFYTVLNPLYSSAQPGWQDFTPRYFYSILDENGNEISFKENADYSIMIDSVLYKSPNIPQDSLKPALCCEYKYDNQIRINDFSLSFPKKSFDRTQKNLEIKIIHGTDTMYICQSTGIGSIQTMDLDGEKIKPIPDFTLQFIAGHYCFPYWAKDFLKDLPQINGDVKITNTDQRHFIVPESIYNSMLYEFFTEDVYKMVEDHVAESFAKGHYTLSRTEQPTTFDRLFEPYRYPHWEWDGNNYYFPTKKKEEYLGAIKFRYNVGNYSGSRAVVGKYNFKNNTMKLWTPTKELIYSSSMKLLKDTLNNVFYNLLKIRDSNCKDIIYRCDFEYKFYHSTNDGNTWKEHQKLTELYQKHAFRELEFLDKDHALIFKFDKVKPPDSKREIIQGVYYLLRDFDVVDSIKTPSDIHFKGGRHYYRYNRKNDTVFIGNWSFNSYTSIENTENIQLILIHHNNKWEFQGMEKQYVETVSKPIADTIYYQNFKLINNTLYLNATNGSLVFQDDLSFLHKKGFLLENGQEIYLFNLKIGTLFSFDGGQNWYVYPLPLERGSRLNFLEINKQGVISYLKNSMDEGFVKVFNRFRKL